MKLPWKQKPGQVWFNQALALKSSLVKNLVSLLLPDVAAKLGQNLPKKFIS